MGFGHRLVGLLIGLISNREILSRQSFHLKCISFLSYVKVLSGAIPNRHNKVYIFGIKSFYIVQSYANIEPELSIRPIQPSCALPAQLDPMGSALTGY